MGFVFSLEPSDFGQPTKGIYWITDAVATAMRRAPRTGTAYWLSPLLIGSLLCGDLFTTWAPDLRLLKLGRAWARRKRMEHILLRA